MVKPTDPYTSEPFPPMRRWAVDNGWLNRRRHIIHALLELDVTLPQIHTRIRSAQSQSQSTREAGFMDWFLRLPTFLRHWFYLYATAHPLQFRTLLSPVLVTAVGMFGQGGGWGIPAPTFPRGRSFSKYQNAS